MPKFCLNKRDSDWMFIEQLLNPSFPLFVWKGVLIFILFSCVNNGLAHQDRRGVLTNLKQTFMAGNIAFTRRIYQYC